jgi:hypothetical protein
MVGPPAAPASVSAQPARAAATTVTRPAAQPKPAAPPPPPAPAPDSGGDDFAQLMAEAEEYALAEEPKLTQKPKARTAGRAAAPGAGMVSLAAQINGPGGVATAAVPSGAPSAFLPYARAIPKRTDEATAESQIRDLYAPLGLIVAGVLVYFLDAYIRHLHNPVMMSVFVIVTCMINLIMVGTALMIAVKVAGLGLGNIGPAILKIIAVAILPSAIGDIIGFYTFGIASLGVSLLLYYVAVYCLFDVDPQETYIVTGTIWVVNILANFLLLAVLFSAIGVGAARSNSFASSGSGSSGSGSGGASQFFAASGANAGDREPIPPNPDETAENEIKAGTAVEFLEWIKPDLHGVMRGSRWEAQQMAERYYKAGAKKVWAMEIARKPKDPVEICHAMVIELPDDPKARKAFLEAEYGSDPAEEGVQDPHAGKRFFTIRLD